MEWISVDLALPKNSRARRAYAAYVWSLQSILQKSKSSDAVLGRRAQMLFDSWNLPTKHQAIYRASALVLTDLALQGWRLRIGPNNSVAVAKQASSKSREHARHAIRMQELLKRDAQLARPSVRAFIRRMEAKSLFNERFVSIFDLMRDGHELSGALREARNCPANGDALNAVVRPYIQFVDSQKRCSFTGLRLMDIWRYFRHTWTNQYASVPGRSISILVRDAAAENHPVMGIAAISSPIIQIGERDKWLGWHPDTFIGRLQANPTARLAQWLHTTVDAAIKEIYVADLVKLKLVSRWRIERPTSDAVRRLRIYAIQQKKRHFRVSRRADFRDDATNTDTVIHWRKQARMPLFRSKRARALADLLDVRMHLRSHFKGCLTAKKLKEFVDSGVGRRTVAKVVRKAKADRVGVAMADMTVCGAVQPYNAVLVGKLVSMLAVGPSVVAEYKRRYGHAVSQIASSMAGRPIIRPPNLVYLGTTSLYGNGSSQYNRVKVPARLLGGTSDAHLEYIEIGQSESFGTSQFSDETVAALVDCLRQSTNGERVHSIFGEGSSPRLRRTREGLALLGFPEQTLLQHGRRRGVYGVMLASNARDYLIGLDQVPQFLVPIKGETGDQAIVSWWRHRWLSGRIQSDQVLKQVAEHQHIHPMRHGARVRLPLEENSASVGAGPN